MKNRLFAYFDIEPTKAYPIVYAPVYTDTFNEEINSMSIVLDNIDKINLENPYHFVKITNELEEGDAANTERFLFNGKDHIIMLLDSFVETQTTLNGSIKYKYQINLMNNVKLLEKIQCPNRIITHSLIDERTTIWDEIDKYMKLYCPKIKESKDGENWSYEYLLDWDDLNVHPFNDTICADMQMNSPTLRQLITNLMLQVGCIPTINYRTMGALDYNSLQPIITPTESDGVNFISHSAASDSYANTLVQAPTQALDNNNEVVADLISFRDSDNAIIKQTQNLMLETRFPIYKINEVRMIDTQNKTGYVGFENQNYDYYPIIYSNTHDDSDNAWISYYGVGEYMYINIPWVFISGVTTLGGVLKNIKVHFMAYENNEYVEVYKYEEEKSFYLDPPDDITEDKSFEMYGGTGAQPEEGGTPITVSGHYTYTYHFNGAQIRITSADYNRIQYVWIENDYETYDGQKIHQLIPMSEIDSHGFVQTKSDVLQFNSALSFNDIYSGIPQSQMSVVANLACYFDITSCFVESRKRQLLDTNFATMNNELFTGTPDQSKTLNDLAKYVYGTIGYSIGSNKLTGFSQTYSRAQLWWSITRSYFDTILRFIQERKDRLLRFDSIEFYRAEGNNITTYLQNNGYDGLTLTDNNFRIEFSQEWVDLNDWSWEVPYTAYSKMKWLFSIRYQPLNNLKLKLGKQKKEYMFDIEQLNQSGDGLSDYSRLMKNVQETVDRIGNQIKSIPQVIDDTNKLYPLNSLYEGYTIFHRQIQIYENYLNVTYTASEDYVIKNYFTSIITKYRAYEYVDYNQSVERKENTRVYCLISDKHYYDGDDHIVWFDNFYNEDYLKQIFGLEDLPDFTNPIDYIEGSGFTYGLIYPDKSRTVYIPKDLYIRNIISNNIDLLTSTENIKGTVSSNKKVFQSQILDSKYINTKVINQMKENISAFNQLIDNIYMSEPTSSYYVNKNQFDALQKMNGRIFQDSNDDLYRISVKVIQEPQDTVLLSDVSLSNTDYALIKNMLQNVKTEIGSAITFYPNSQLKDIVIKKGSIQIAFEPLSESESLEAINQRKEYQAILLSGLTNYLYDYKFKYAIESSYNSLGNYEEVKNECSVLVSDTSLAINYRDYDNISAGPYLESLDLKTRPSEGAAGGYVQKWQVWDYQKFGQSHEISFSYDLLLNEPSGADTIDDYIAQLPVINKGWEYKPYSILQIVDDNKSDSSQFTFYKDNAEVLNHTVQFEFYSDKNDVLIGKNFISHNRIVNQLELYENEKLVAITDMDYKIEEQPYSHNTVEDIEDFMLIDYDEQLQLPYIQINWDATESDVIKIALSASNNNYIRDLIAFNRNKRSGQVKYYLTINDTKSNDVWYVTDEDDLPTIYECSNSTYGEITPQKTISKTLTISGRASTQTEGGTIVTYYARIITPSATGSNGIITDISFDSVSSRVDHTDYEINGSYITVKLYTDGQLVSVNATITLTIVEPQINGIINRNCEAKENI